MGELGAWSVESSVPGAGTSGVLWAGRRAGPELGHTHFRVWRGRADHCLKSGAEARSPYCRARRAAHVSTGVGPKFHPVAQNREIVGGPRPLLVYAHPGLRERDPRSSLHSRSELGQATVPGAARGGHRALRMRSSKFKQLCQGCWAGGPL